MVHAVLITVIAAVVIVALFTTPLRDPVKRYIAFWRSASPEALQERYRVIRAQEQSRSSRPPAQSAPQPTVQSAARMLAEELVIRDTDPSDRKMVALVSRGDTKPVEDVLVRALESRDQMRDFTLLVNTLRGHYASFDSPHFTRAHLSVVSVNHCQLSNPQLASWIRLYDDHGFDIYEFSDSYVSMYEGSEDHLLDDLGRAVLDVTEDFRRNGDESVFSGLDMQWAAAMTARSTEQETEHTD